MAQTMVRGSQVLDHTIQRVDLDVTTVGNAVITKLIQGSNITLSSTGADAGTGDVTISAPAPLLRGYIANFTLSNGTPAATMLSVGSGMATDNAMAINIVNNAIFNKSISGSWIAGSGNNGMGFSLTAAANTWYHVFAIINAGNFDVYFDNSVTAANAPSGTTAFRRIGSIRLNASIQITPFTQFGDEFLWLTVISETPSGLNLSTTNTTLTLTGVPLGVKVWGLFESYIATLSGQSAANVVISAPDQGTQTVDTPFLHRTQSIYTPTPGTNAFTVPIKVRTNSSAQLQVVASSSGAQLYFTTYGWIDDRGKNN